MTDVIIASGVRTAIGTFGGAFAGTPPCDLAAAVASEAILRAKISPDEVGQSVFGNVIHTEPRDMYLARVAALTAGVPERAPALTLNRLCGSGLQAVVSAAEQIILDRTEIALAGGAECMSRVGHCIREARFGAKMGDVQAIDMMTGALTDPFGNGHMGVTAENVSEEQGIARGEQDALALESHRRAAVAIAEGRFTEQILPVTVQVGRKEHVFDTDEHVRWPLTAEELGVLRPVFRKDGTVTPGNASGINDGAAALVLASATAAQTRGLPVLARIHAYGLGGVRPEVMGLGPIPAVREALARAGLTIADMDCIESNEAFAAQAIAVARDLRFPSDITNPNGGAIALGHPVGASGAIILIKLIHELRRTGGRFGLATMCIGGGQGIAVIIENTQI